MKDLITDPLLGTADVWANLPPSEHAQFEELTALTVGFVPGMEYQNTDKVSMHRNRRPAGRPRLYSSCAMMPGRPARPDWSAHCHAMLSSRGCMSSNLRQHEAHVPST